MIHLLLDAWGVTMHNKHKSIWLCSRKNVRELEKHIWAVKDETNDEHAVFVWKRVVYLQNYCRSYLGFIGWTLRFYLKNKNKF